MMRSHVPGFALAMTFLLGGCSAAGARTRPAGDWKTQVNRPSADREVLLREVRYRLDAGGRVTHEVYERQRVLTDRGADVHCDPRVTYDAGRQTFRVLRAETRMRSGKVVRTPPGGVNTVTPRSLARAPGYIRFTDTVVSLLGIEPGAVTDFRYRLTDREPSPAPFGGVVAVGDVGPLRRLVIQVEVPRGKRLRYACVRCRAGRPAILRRAGRVRYRWTFTNLKATNLYEASGRRRSPPPTDPLPHLVFTTAPTWPAAVASLASVLRVKPAATVTGLARRLGKGKTSARARLLAALRFVTHSLVRIRFDALGHGLLPVPAGTVLGRGYGHALDRGVLLLALLEAMRLPAKPLLLGGRYGFARSVPTLAQLHSMWVEVQTEDGTLWVDPQNGRLHPVGADRAGSYQLAITTAAKPVLIGPGRAAAAKLAVSGVIGPRGRTKIQGALSLEGAANPFSRASAWVDKARKKTLKGIARRVWRQAGKGSRTTTSKPGLLRSRFTLSGVGKLTNDKSGLAIFRLPDACVFLDRIDVRRARPQLPLRLPAAKLSCKLALSVAYAPDVYEPAIWPRSLTVKTRVGQYERVVQAGRGRLNVVVKLTVKGPQVAPAQVTELRRLLAAARAEEAHLVVFRRLKRPGPRPGPRLPPPTRIAPVALRPALTR